ncbi:MAG: SusC/RagA family TonB-linked outer membrane protein [Bacteroidaceae bacterium]|nr:SusC/RagA family TonB-linked outer membrane protein [Bacteroidaceae bacterium]
MKMFRIYSLSLLLCSGMVVLAQEPATGVKENTESESKQVPVRIVKGRVLSALTDAPLAGAMVSTTGISGYSTLTGEDGTYELQVPRFASSVTVSAPAHNALRRGLAGSEVQRDITLLPSTLKNDNTGLSETTSPVQAEGFGYSPAVTIEDEIGARLGAQVRTSLRSGVPGIGGVMFIDGLHSLNANAQPLIVIDGVIFDQQYGRQTEHSGFYNSILSNVNPADIERISVLRNGTSLYGAKGANGVILIETRRNKSMATRITASLSAGVTMEPKYIDMMDAGQYRSYASELLRTTDTKVSSFKFLNDDPTYYYYGQYHNNTDWKKEVYRTAFTQNYGINVEGGDDVANYNLSLGYTNAQSTMEYNDMNRLNIRFNTDIKFSSKFSARFDASFANQSRNLRDDGAPMGYENGSPTSPSFLAYAKSPFLSPYVYAGGQIYENHLDVTDETYLDEALSNYAGYNYKLANPYAIGVYGDAENKNRFENSMLNVAVTPRYQITPNLSVSEHFSYNLISSNEKYYLPINGVPDFYVESVADYRQNEVRSMAAKQNSVMSDTRLQWTRRFGAHSLDLFGGARINWESYSVTSQLGYNTGNDKTPFIHSGLADARTTGGTDEWTNIAWYAQAGYNYLGRYFLQANLTAEASSRFGAEADGLDFCNTRWGLFPGVQAAWEITSEPWMANVRGVDYLRLGVGLDIAGNDDVNYHAAHSYLASDKYLYSILGLSFAGIGNPKIQWERTRRLNASLHGTFLNNRLSLQLNAYKAETDNLLTLQKLSYLTGLEHYWGNGGAMSNQGFDLSLNGRVIVTRAWQWELGFSLGHYRNEITSLPATDGSMDTELYGATVRSQVGQAAGVFYGYRSLGVFSTSEEAAAAALYQVESNGTHTYFAAGDVHFADLDGNHCIDEADRTIIGDPNPDLYGNIFTSLSYKRLRLDVGLNYSLGGDVYNYMRSQLEGGSRFMNQTLALTRRWHGEGHVTDMPRITFQDPMGNARFSDRWIEDGSYLRLRSVTLSYQLPVNSTFLQGLEFWVQGNNLFTLTNYLGTDPEVAATSNVIGQGIDTGLLPQSRSFFAGVKIKL